MATRPCTACSGPMLVSSGSRLTPTCHPCRRTIREATGPRRDLRKRDTPYGNKRATCRRCQRVVWLGTGSRPDPMCQPCRRVEPQLQPANRRARRDAGAPGLRPGDRSKLLRKWKRQQRRCSYCPALATTIDHVVPLLRGGTNFEGNLAPCCLSCNSRKNARFLTEWRAGRRHIRAKVVA